MSFGNGGGWPQRKPLYSTKREMLAILRVYKGWYDEGRSDREISMLIRQRYPQPENNNFRRPFQKGPKKVFGDDR